MLRELTAEYGSCGTVKIVRQQGIDCIPGLADLPLEIRYLRIGRIEYLSRLKHTESRAHTVTESQLGQFHGIVLRFHRLFRYLKL